MKRIYLAGPDVFLESAMEIGRLKRQRCEALGLEGLFPLDSDASVSQIAPDAIFRANCALMDGADAALLNLTPFRGVSADAGTSFELGYLFATGKPLFGYANATADYCERVERAHGPLRPGRFGPVDRDGHFTEDFGLYDNLMLVEALRSSGGGLWMQPSTGSHPALAAIDAFERALEAAAESDVLRKTE